MGAIATINDGDFQAEVLDSERPVLVDFWATWCAPCKLVAPIIEKLDAEYAGKVKFLKMDVDLNPQTPVKYNVRSIPTLIVFKDGAPLDQVVGAVPENVLKQSIDKAL